MAEPLRTVAEMIGDAPAAPQRAAPRIIIPGFPEPGIYFGLPEDEYHRLPGLSNSGIKAMLTSPMNFWANSWLNADRNDEDTEAKARGRAFHTRICEGASAFALRYALALDPADYPNALRTAEDLQKECEAYGLPKSGTKAALAQRLREAGVDVQIWDDLLNQHVAENIGKTFISAAEHRRLAIAAAMIENHPTLSKAFQGGYCEVSIFWYDEETGVPMKARIDYLKLQAIVDLKTFANKFGKPIARAVAGEIANYRYFIQPPVYQEAVAAAKGLWFDLGAEALRIPCPEGNYDRDELLRWMSDFASRPEPQFLFVFQQTGAAPVTLGRIFPSTMATYELGRIAARQAKQRFAECWSIYGEDPWLDLAEVAAFDDTEFPAYLSDF